MDLRICNTQKIHFSSLGPAWSVQRDTIHMMQRVRRGKRVVLLATLFVMASTFLAVFYRSSKYSLVPRHPKSPKINLESAAMPTSPTEGDEGSVKPDTTSGDGVPVDDVISGGNYTRVLTPYSPWRYLVDVRTHGRKLGSSASGKDKLLTEWIADDEGPISREEKCKVLVEALYHDNDDWSHQQNMNGFPSDHANEEFASVMMERLRIYNYCFIEGGIDVADVWSPQLGSSPLEFQHSMFPFLRIPGEGEDALLPTVVDLSTMHKVPLHPAQLDIHNHNRNFWRSWSNMAQGRGIVTTFSAKKFSDFFFRQLKVLQYHNNELPIQIIVQDNEFSDDFIAEIAAAGERTKQSLYLVKISKLLDPANQKYLSGWINKLLANLFNTFEEFILLDADVVPYAAPHTYFSTKEYTSTGLYMFQDRALLSETETICTDTLNSLEPSKQEVELLGSYLQFTHTMDLQGKTQEESTYTALFKKKLPHNVETGLVTANKKSKMFGLVTSLMLNLNTKLRACFWGDKEFYWLGPLFAGVSYTIEPTPAALTGFPLRRYENDIYQNTTLCDTHIAHVRDHELSWINGGLRTFKPEANINYKNIENPPAKMSGCLIPDPAHGPWVREKRVFGHIHCAAVVEPDLDLTPYGEVIRFDEETQQRTDDISKIWNSNIDEHV